MITNLKDINKYFRLAKWNLNKAIDLAKKNTIVGEIRFPGPVKVRKPITEPVPALLEKPKRGRKAKTPKEKGLPDLDKDGYMKGRPPTTED